MNDVTLRPPKSNSIIDRSIDFVGSKSFIILFSFVSALLWTISFYPGILYSDSIPRWQLAIEVANNGVSHLSYFGSHHPVIPSILQAPFYAVTKEVGLFIFFQAAVYCLSVFYFVRSFYQSAIVNILVGATLWTPINHIYAIFHSFDSIFSISLILLAASLWRLRSGYSHTLFAASLCLIFLCTASRINSILLIIPITLYITFIFKGQLNTRRRFFVLPALALFFSALPIMLTASLNMKGGNSWAMGFAWEYANLATKSENEKHRKYLLSIGAKPDALKDNICYHGIWCGHEYGEVISKASGNGTIATNITKNYLDIVLHEPKLFLSEKLKYLSSLLGISRNLENFEIGKWRTGNWAEPLADLGFHSTPEKEQVLDKYFEFSQRYSILFKPYVIFGVVAVAILIALILGWRTIALGSSLTWGLAALYYATFFITAQNHELRYFFPSLLLMQGVTLTIVSRAIGQLSRPTLTASLLVLLLIMGAVHERSVRHNFIQKKNLMESAAHTQNLDNGLVISYVASNQLAYYFNDCTSAELNKRFFLHAYYLEGEKGSHSPRQSMDFYWKDKEIPKIAWFPSFEKGCLALIDLDQRKLHSLNTGQFLASGKRLWEQHINYTGTAFGAPMYLQPFNLSDSHWEAGISKSRTGFFISNTPWNRQVKQGGAIILSNGESRVITNVHLSKEYINVDISGKKLDPKVDGYPSQLKYIAN